MTCPGCDWDREVERAAIQKRDVEPAEHTCDPTIDVLHVPHESFHATPQVGTPMRLSWIALGSRLARPTIGGAKDCAGAWSPALYRGAVRRKSALQRVCALVADVDEGGDVRHVADVIGNYRAIVHSTFSSTPDAPRCRIVFLLARPIDAPTYEATHAVVRAHLGAVGVVVDAGAKDASRVSYWPVRRPGDPYLCVEVDGEPLDARAVIAAQPPAPPRSTPRLVAPAHRDTYRQAALRRAADAVASASDGDRHAQLCREAWSLARLDLTEHEISAALLPAFVARAGEPRRREGERAIRDACAARRRA